MDCGGASDKDLFTDWAGGDRRAGHTLFSRHFKHVRRFFANKAPDHVEDLVQRTFARCVESKTRFAQRSSFRTFLFGIARNILREHYRHLRRSEEIDFVEQHSVEDLGAGLSTLAAARREQRLLLHALRRLPLANQTLLELYFWEDLTAPQIAEICDIPENTVRSRIRRSRTARSACAATAAA